MNLLTEVLCPIFLRRNPLLVVRPKIIEGEHRMGILAIIPLIIYIVLIVWFISVLNTIARNTAQTNQTLERVLWVLEGKPSRVRSTEASGLGLPIYKAPDEYSTILFHAPESWALSFGEVQNEWFPVEIVGDAPASVMHQHGWVREADLDQMA
jgi:hypothetical protein